MTHALQTLWDEQFQVRHGPHNLMTNEMMYSYDDEWDGDDWWGHDAMYHDDSWDDGWGHYDWDEAYYTEPHETSQADQPGAEDDVAIKEAQQAEKVAESLLADAQRTWTEAQRATQALRRDRGFGQHVGPQSHQVPRGPCFICHGPHHARECPDRSHPGYHNSKGYGKRKGKGNYMAEYEEYTNFFTSKGKGKGKKGKNAHWLDAQLWSKGKSKGKNKSSSAALRPSVNAYMFTGGVEMLDFKELNSASSVSKLRDEQGLIDCGATASAGPLVAVESLISSVLAKDRQANIEVQQSARPYFRFGNGQWGRALYRVVITSNVSGSSQQFKLFALPNPPELHHPGFDKSTLVPILVGMDHLGGATGMTIDFPTGMAMDSFKTDFQAYQLPSNKKGHYLLDIVEYLTRGKECLEGHASVHITTDELPETANLHTLEFHPVEYYDISMTDSQHDVHSRSEAVQRLKHLHAHVQHLRSSPSAIAALMTSGLVNDQLNSNLSASLSGHGVLQGQDHCGRGSLSDRTGEGRHSSQGKSHAIGSRKNDGDGLSGSQIQSSTVAMLRPTCGNSGRQQPRSLEHMQSVRLEDPIYSSSGKQFSTHQVGQSGDDYPDAQGDLQAHTGQNSYTGSLQSSSGQDRCGGGDECNLGDNQDYTHAEQASILHRPQQVFSQHESKSFNLGFGNSSCESGEGLHGRNGSAADLGGKGPDHEHSSSPKSSSRTRTRKPRSGPSIRGRTESMKDEEMLKPLQPKIAAKLMLMAAALTSSLATGLVDFCLDNCDGVWEVACSPHSWLSEACEQQGLRPRRINLEKGYDLYKKDTWEDLKLLRRRTKPRKIWFSLPCTKYCQWTFINYATDERKELLKTYQRRERRMLWSMDDFVQDTLEDDPLCEIYFEWTHPCRGWQEPPMVDLEKYMSDNGREWLDCRIDGCNYGMKDSTGQHFIRKKWLIKTTDELFHKNFRAKTCPGSHSHTWIQGQETARSAYYPWRMVQAIARFWRQQLASDRSLRLLTMKEDFKSSNDLLHDCGDQGPVRDLCHCGALSPCGDLLPKDDLLHPDALPVMSGEPVVETADGDVPSPEEVQRWQSKIAQYHRAAGHPTNRNLARLVKNAGQPEWKIQEVLKYQCPACASIKPGGTSSGAIPPASTAPMYRAWQAVAMDTAEWLIPGTKRKLKFLLMMDLATKLRVAHIIKEYDNMTMEAENAEDIITGFSEKWLSILPKPDLVILDSSKTFTSEKLREFLININVQVHIIAEKEPWANGVVEAAIQDIKNVASAIQLENLPQAPSVTLFLATSALNSTEYTAGFSSFQWAYGKQYTLRDEDYRTFQQVPPGMDFQNLIQLRQLAEEIAVKTKAKRTLSKLANTTVRQPLRTFNPMDLVKVWRKLQPSDQHKGVRGGHKKSGRPQWIGPGRVIFQEVLPHQPEGDHRRHILWVLIGNRVMRCSVHSVRLCTEPERLQHDLTADEDPTSWKTLADILPKREFTDLVDQAPSAEELELPDLPAEPDDSTLIPIRRAHSKQTYGPQDFRRIHRSSPLGVRPDPHAPQHYDRPQPGGSAEPSAVDLASRAHQRGEYSPSIAPASPPAFDDDGDGLDRSLGINDYGPTTSQPKKPRLEYDLKWVEQLEQGAKEEAQHLDFMTVLEEQDECLLFNIDLEFESNRQLKNFERNPVSYLVKKINSSEVNLKRLTTDELDLFKRAKHKEVDSFIKNEAVRRCLDSKEVAEAYNSNRILKARWVLTWKNISPDEKEEALLDRQQNSNTTVNQQATKKAKARIVLLGYQHPSLLDRGFKTSAPVQSTLGRNLLYVLATTHQWELNGLDLATAFLQTQPTEADSRLWTTGVEELREALGVPHDSVLRILRNIYGSTTAPRGLWLDLHRTLTSLDGVAALGERCLWLWFSKTELDSTGQFPRLIGAMGGHVDDFHRVGDVNSAEWMATCEKIDKAYKWGTVKRRSYRHAGTDISTIDTPNGFKIVVDQDAYVESLPDLQISRERLRADGPLSDAEKGFCRTALGGLQWLAIQTQPQLCSRCNILLTEITTNGTMQHAREIQGMISEVRAEPQRLHFFRLPTVEHWNQLVFITMGDQAHANRPNGDSTGGIVSMIAGPESINGAVCPMMLTAWRSWKLRRKAIASNDAEIQAVLEGEDQNFRIRLLWTEIHGGGFLRGDPREDLVTATEKQVVQIKGIICTDSRGGYDAVEVNESPLLGLSNLRSALQAFQLRENLRRVGAELRWVASDYDLADAMTKKKSDSREALLKFMQCQLWSIAFDPQFRAAKRNKQAGLTAISKVNRALQQDHARALQNNDTVNAALISNLLAGEDSIHLYDDGPF